MKKVAPLSQTQMGIYVDCQSLGEKGAYNRHYLYTLDDSIDLNRLAKAIEKTLKAHPAVFTRIRDKDGEIFQEYEAEEYRQSVMKMTEAEWRKKLAEIVAAPFELNGGRLFQFELVETERGKYLFRGTHHVIFDGMTFRILFDDITKAYLDPNAELETENYDALDIANDEVKERATAKFIQAKTWYEKNFDGIDVESLPLANRDEKEAKFGIFKRNFPLNYSEIKAFCKENNVSPTALTSAAFALVAGIYTHQNEALFSTLYNGRAREKTKHIAGMLVKTLPMYCSWTKGEKISDFLRKLTEDIKCARDNSLFSFADLNKICPMNNAPMFSYHGFVRTIDEICGKPCKQENLDANATGKPLEVALLVNGENMTLNIEYNGGLYSEKFIETFACCYENVLRQLMEKNLVGEVELLNDAQKSALDAFNNTEVAYDESATVVSLFNQAAKAYPNNTAVIFEDKKFTYGEIDRISTDIAAFIAEKNIGRGDVVSILIPRSEFITIASLGALKAGSSYQPLDPTYPSDRLNFMIRDSAAKLLITTKKLRHFITNYEGETLYIDEIPPAPKNIVLPETKPEDTFILLYTSGSTGTPKGVKLTHGNLVCFIDWYKKYFDLKPENCVGAYASFGFDANMMDMYPALSVGAAICIVPEEMRLNLMDIGAYFKKHNVTHAFITTQVGRQFAMDIADTTLKYLLVGGEKLVPLDPPKNYSLINFYGPTECTVGITTFKVEKKEKNIPIGYPMDNVKLYIVDGNGHRVPAGACGELLAAGCHVGNGYLNRPKKTAEVFVKNPFDGGKYENLYKTGDIVRYRENGAVEFVGRRDGQVKIRGFRVELTEVEAVIREFPDVKDATVVSFDHPAGGKFIAAYVVGENAIDIKSLNEFIAERKPPYMIPAVTMQIDKIPLNQNGKVNRRAIPAPNLQGAGKDENIKRNFNILEKTLKEIIGEIVGLKDFGVATQLNYLGLASISAIKLSTMLYKRFGVRMAAQKLTSATVESIENELLNHWMKGETTETKKADAPKNSAKISGVQRGIYLECMKDPLSTMYNIPFICNFERGTNASKLAESVKKIVAAHLAVNAHFELDSDDVTQVLNASANFEIPVKKATEAEFNEIKNNFVQPFRLSSGALYRFMIVETEKRTSLFCDFHHLVFDGASVNLFLNDLKTALNGKNIEAEKFTYFDYVAEETELIEGNRKYFADMLKDFESASEITSNAKHTERENKILDKPLDLKAIEGYSKLNSVTPAALCLSALGYAVARYTAAKRVYLTTISSGRGNVKFADTFGMFVNTLPIKIDIDDVSVKNFVENVANTFAGAIEHENYPFSEIAKDYRFEPKIMYEYQRGVIENPAIPNFTGIENFSHKTAKFKLIVRIIDKDGAPYISVEYDAGDYTDKFIEDFADSFNIVLKKFTENSDYPLRKVSMLDEKRAKILAAFHSNTNPASVQKVYGYFHEGFEEQAAKNPDNLALIAADCTLTYGELEKQANKIANALISRGVSPKGKIALLLPRASREIIAMLGVLKAGCAFIPCDINYPAERIGQILEDSAAAYVITTADRANDAKFIDVEELLKCEDNSRPDIAISPDDLAYLIYTSGSTGKPKGVMLTHGGAANYFTANPANLMVDILVKNAKNYLSVTTFAFDMSLKEIGPTLFNGLTLILASEDEANNPDKLTKLILKTNAEVINATPSRLLQYMEAEEFCAAVKNFKLIVSGGEKYSDILLKKLKEKTSARIVNTYGPTEITISSNAKELTDASEISIGRPLLNVTEFIVDGDENELPPGLVGELYIGGAGVAKGYNNLPETTKERFTEYNGARVYKSGDYARWTDEGDVEILGRMDNQIKLRGLRIEIGEIEGVLAKIEGIKTAVVKIVKLKGIEHLCAYFTAEKPIDIEDLKANLGKTLPAYMVPTAYLQLEKMPMTLNGKIDVKSLPKATVFRNKSGVKAANKAEKDFCDIFGKILNIEDVGADESFFDLGGTSLLVTRVVIMAQKLNYKVNFSDVFMAKTPKGLAALQVGEKNTTVDEKIADFDYSVFDKLLTENNLDNFKKGEKEPIGDIVLTGATGYLGIHVLQEFIEHRSGKVYCLLRGKGELSATTRLKSQLYYYFDESYSDLFGTRIFIIEGDVTNPESLERIKSLENVSTLINCAALVKHFSSGDEIETVNLGGVKNLLSVCKAKNLRLIQISTMSTVRSGIRGEVDENAVPTERTLYFGQNLTNQYIHSKFLAERAILEAVVKDGLTAKIMRVGNLSARYLDGEFQINAGTNASMGRIKTYALIGCCPFSDMDRLVEFSPIDEVAKTILILSETPKECVIFHPINQHNMSIGDVVRAMRECGLSINFVEEEDYKKAWTEAENDPEKANVLTSTIAYSNIGMKGETITFPKNNLYTMQVLYRMGYAWPVTMWEYVEKFIIMLKRLGFFGIK